MKALSRAEPGRAEPLRAEPGRAEPGLDAMISFGMRMPNLRLHSPHDMCATEPCDGTGTAPFFLQNGQKDLRMIS